MKKSIATNGIKKYIFEEISKQVATATEAVVRRRSIKNVFLKIVKNSQENTCATVNKATEC